MKRTVHYVVSTHWDREWYQTFQDYRDRLVSLLDRTIGDLESGKLQGPFTMDGQAIMLEDYLEIRSDRRDLVAAMLRDGRLVAGPWYVLPDEWLVSGESLVRNIRMGRDTVRDFGAKPSDAGFVCDLFGHIGQLPQLLSGFGIKGAFIWRGLEPTADAYFNWSASDGTSLPCYRFGRMGYCDYDFDVRHANQANLAFDPETAAKDLQEFIEKEAQRCPFGPLLVFDGGDHLEYDEEHYAVLLAAANKPDAPYQIVHSTLDAYLDELVTHRGQISQSVKGELRQEGRLPTGIEEQWLIPGVLSSRIWIKQANANCESLLCNWAEPVGAMAALTLGRKYPEEFLRVAWKWLLANHPHDSICGCSIDEVHEDMKYRFAQASQIANRQGSQAARTIAASIEGEIGADELRMVLFNPLAHDLNEPLEVTLQIPAEWATFAEYFFFELKPAFRIFDASGQELPYQRVSQAMNRLKARIHRVKFPEPYQTNDVTVCLQVAIPARGYTTLTVRAAEKVKHGKAALETVVPVRHPSAPGLATAENAIENEYLRVVAEPNGTLTLTDKRNGEVYHRLMTIEECADIGDGWYHGPAVGDQVFASTGAQAQIALVCDGPLQASLRIQFQMRVPAEFDWRNMRRSTATAELVFDSLVTLRAGSDRVEISTQVENAPKDHRVRVLFPTGAKADTYLADGAFDVIERPIALPKDNHIGREVAVETRPQFTWTGVADSTRGLAVVSAGLPESTVRDLPERPLALTLFRGTGRTYLQNGQPAGQLNGSLSFRFWLVPVRAGMDRTRLCNLGTLLSTGVRNEQLRMADANLYKIPGKVLAPSSGFLKVEGSAVVTSLRHTSGGLELRIFNPDSTSSRVKIITGQWCSQAEPVDFEGNPAGAKLSVKDGILEMELSSKRIATLRLNGAVGE